MKILIQFDEHDGPFVGTRGETVNFLALILRKVTMQSGFYSIHRRTMFELRGELVTSEYHTTQPPMPADIPALPDATNPLEEKSIEQKEK